MAEQNDLAKSANQRKFRVSPLNFATALFFIAAAYIFITGIKINGLPSGNWSNTIAWIFILFGFVVSFLDLIFRNFFTLTKNLWIVELSFITLVLIIFFLVK
ncbi:hypothetical protein ACFQZX_12560 [Mucilaginibacter litoreus]|uniref:Uncharacterized protein n=1 Tax=Mucilaginibacter litoreus TaxID=1048221 RepID=A0ABW3AVG4_9SPHI